MIINYKQSNDSIRITLDHEGQHIEFLIKQSDYDKVLDNLPIFLEQVNKWFEVVLAEKMPRGVMNIRWK